MKVVYNDIRKFETFFLIPPCSLANFHVTETE